MSKRAGYKIWNASLPGLLFLVLLFLLITNPTPVQAEEKLFSFVRSEDEFVAYTYSVVKNVYPEINLSEMHLSKIGLEIVAGDEQLTFTFEIGSPSEKTYEIDDSGFRGKEFVTFNRETIKRITRSYIEKRRPGLDLTQYQLLRIDYSFINRNLCVTYEPSLEEFDLSNDLIQIYLSMDGRLTGIYPLTREDIARRGFWNLGITLIVGMGVPLLIAILWVCILIVRGRRRREKERITPKGITSSGEKVTGISFLETIRAAFFIGTGILVSIGVQVAYYYGTTWDFDMAPGITFLLEIITDIIFFPFFLFVYIFVARRVMRRTKIDTHSLFQVTVPFVIGLLFVPARYLSAFVVKTLQKLGDLGNFWIFVHYILTTVIVGILIAVFLLLVRCAFKKGEERVRL